MSLPRFHSEIDLYEIPDFMFPYYRLERLIRKEVANYSSWVKKEIIDSNVVCNDLVDIILDYIVSADLSKYTLCDVELREANDVHTFGTFSRWGYMIQGARNPDSKSIIRVPDFRMKLKDKEDLYFVAYSQDGVIGISFRLEEE